LQGLVYFQKTSAAPFGNRSPLAARSLGLLIGRSAKSPGRSCPTQSPNLPYSKGIGSPAAAIPLLKVV